MTGEPTVRSVTFDLLRSLGLTTVFGNPGSTEQTFLQEFPDDFTYVLALQEASVIAMADAFAQVKSLVRGIESGMKRESESVYRVDIVPIGAASASAT